jgi:hypothetical protein
MGSSFAGTDNATPCGFLIDSLTINIRSSDESYQIKIGANDKSAPLPAVVIVEELDACFVVRDPEQALVYFNVINDALALDGKAHLSLSFHTKPILFNCAFRLADISLLYLR